MPNKIIDKETGFIQFSRTPEEKESIELKEKIFILEEKVNKLLKLLGLEGI